MKKFKTVLLITGMLVAGLAFSSVAQTRENENQDKQLYALKHDKHKTKHKDKAYKDKTDKKEYKKTTKPRLKSKFHKNKDKREPKAE
jgi:hypothetical protein